MTQSDERIVAGGVIPGWNSGKVLAKDDKEGRRADGEQRQDENCGGRAIAKHQ